MVVSYRAKEWSLEIRVDVTLLLPFIQLLTFALQRLIDGFWIS
jgi:hypothetical protein